MSFKEFTVKKLIYAVFSIFFIFMFSSLQSQTLENIPGNDFNNAVVSVLKSYPTDGTCQYYWPSSGNWAGNTKDLYYRGSLFSQGDTFQRCYCCGLTFEVFFFAYQKYCQDHGWNFIIQNMDSAALRTFRMKWFGSDGNRKTLQNAIVSSNLGYAISLDQAKIGDFIQFWRYSGSGHSVIFIEWVFDANGNKNGLKYWSTQPATNGIGYRIEYFGGKTGIDPEQIYIARVGK